MKFDMLKDIKYDTFYQNTHTRNQFSTIQYYSQYDARK